MTAFSMVYIGGFSLLSCVGFCATARGDITFVLDPGATITPLFGSTEIGPAEPLAGSFVWHDLAGGGLEVFDAVSLHLSSPSFDLTLDTTAANDEGSNTFLTGGSYFGEVIDGIGFAHSTLLLLSYTEGAYVGNYTNPTQVKYDDVRLSPPGGGLFEGRLAFSATAVPEPTCLSLLGWSGLGLLLRRRQR